MRQARSSAGAGRSVSRSTTVRTTPTGRTTTLVVRCLSQDEQHCLLLEERRGPPAPAALERYGLTRREAEILAWVAQGKTNPEIGIILGIRPKTVSKHLERIFPKLGVENRAAAAVVAFPPPE